MRLKICILFMLFTYFVSSCKTNTDEASELSLKEKKLQLQEKELELKEREKRLNEQSSKSTSTNTPTYPQYRQQTTPANKDDTPVNNVKTKFCYVYVETNEPEEEYRYGDLDGNGSGMYASPEFFNYKSSVTEIKNFTEDEKYRLIDRFEQQVRNQYEIKNMKLASLNAECKILSSECFSFDTYKAASEHRRKK